MTDDDRKEFARLCALMSQAFDKPMSEVLIGVYFDALDDFDISEVSSAVKQAVQTHKFMPKVAELRQLIEGAAEDRASQAWAAFLDVVADGGQSSVLFADRATAMAMDAVFGGWVQACRLLSAGWVTDSGENKGGCSDEMLAHYQKSFFRQYVAALNNRRDVEMYRPGLAEMSMREGGAAWSGRMPTIDQPVILVGAGRAISVRLPFDVAAGQLTEEARACIGAGEEAVKALAFAQRRALGSAERKSLPPAGEEMATPEQVAELKSSIAALVGSTSRRSVNTSQAPTDADDSPFEDQFVEA